MHAGWYGRAQMAAYGTDLADGLSLKHLEALYELLEDGIAEAILNHIEVVGSEDGQAIQLHSHEHMPPHSERERES